MKKLLTTFLAAIMVIVSAFSLTACSGEGVSIKNTYVDDNNHIIVEFTDGSKKDLGTVEEIIPVYTVTFVDINGNVIETQQVYKGLPAKAPNAPQIPDQVFSGWSADITNIQGNITVSPVYGNIATYTVTFKDEQGNTIKTETVISGRSATAPTNLPVREETIFDRWDKNFSNITSDTVITAVYRAKKDCVVTFKDYSGITLGTANVKEGGNVTAPVTPARDGYTFKGWSSSLNSVTGDKIVTAEYTLNSGNNIFDIAYKVNGNNVTVTLSLAGTVCLAGFEGTLSFEGMNIVSTDAKSNNMICNANGNSVKMSYSSATNVTKGEVVMEVTLTKTADNGTATLTLDDCFKALETPGEFEPVSYKVIGQNIKLK